MLVVFETLGGGLGDEICSEPVVRYAIKNLYPNDDVRICTRYPEVFKHLKKPMGKNGEELKISAEEKFLHLSASPYKIIEGQYQVHPFASIAEPLFVPTVDFHSMFMIHRILPHKDKRIYLEVTPEAEQSVNSKTPDNFVAFHIGSSSEAKLVYQSYSQDIANGLIARGHKVVAFGNTPVKLEGVIDLTNSLTIEESFALIKKAWLTVTNDSAPVHIAASFDNYLLMIPSIKHPDRLIHARHGVQYWKAAAPYKKLAIRDEDFPPHIPVGSWYREINVEENFPEVSDLMKIVDEWSGQAT